MKRIAILMTILLLSVSCLKLQHKATLVAGKVSLQADTGKFLARCNGCGPGASPDSAAVH